MHIKDELIWHSLTSIFRTSLSLISRLISCRENMINIVPVIFLNLKKKERLEPMYLLTIKYTIKHGETVD